MTKTPLKSIKISLAKALEVLLKSNGETLENVFTGKIFNF